MINCLKFDVVSARKDAENQALQEPFPAREDGQQRWPEIAYPAHLASDQLEQHFKD